MKKKHPFFKRRSAGVLLHVTSLPGPHGIGDLGRPAHRFLDWLEATGWSRWQMLPIGPIGKGESPYSSTSSFAIEPLLTSIDALIDDGLLPRSATKAPEILKNGPVRYASVRRFKEPRLRAAFKQFVALRLDRRVAYQRFVDEEQGWLEPWCSWSSENQGGDPEEHAFRQFVLDRQWRVLRRAAHARHILLFGDMPFFVPLESVDVASNPELFKLRANGRPRLVSGVPKDRFNPNGQLWGHPQYRWSMHEKSRFRWWTDRIAKQFERFDIVRLDHFIGFHRVWQIPSTSRTAHRGSWLHTPGRALLKQLFSQLDSPPLAAEDLGKVTPPYARFETNSPSPGSTCFSTPSSGRRFAGCPRASPSTRSSTRGPTTTTPPRDGGDP